MKNSDKISDYFTYGEATVSPTALRLGINNTPNAATLKNILYAARRLDDVRVLLNTPIIATSWYRSPRLNKRIGGAPGGHPTGFCIDFKTKMWTPVEICEYINEVGIKYDQLIMEYDAWVHISFDMARGRQQYIIKR